MLCARQDRESGIDVLLQRRYLSTSVVQESEGKWERNYSQGTVREGAYPQGTVGDKNWKYAFKSNLVHVVPIHPKT